jgi:methionine-rich copper-binding protein CopC
MLLAAACVGLAFLSALFFTQARAAREELAGSRQLLQQSRGRQAELEGELGRERAKRSPVAESLRAAPVFMLNLTRSSATSAEPEDRVVLPESPGWVTLIFDRPVGLGVQDYRVRITSADGRLVGEAAPARTAEGGMFAVSLPSERLPAGDYVLEVERVAADEAAPLARYRFRAVAEP